MRTRFWILLLLCPILYQVALVTAQDNVDAHGIVGRTAAVLIVAQSLYFGGVAALRRFRKKWRHSNQEKTVSGAFAVVAALSIVELFLIIFADKEWDWANAMITAGPLPIFPPMVAMMMYLVRENSMREEYRRDKAGWDSFSGSAIPIRILCNTWWKWVVYIISVIGVLALTSYTFIRTKNIYPLLISITVPMLTTILGAGIALGQKIEDIQSEIRGSCLRNLVVVPIIGWSTSTSMIIITYRERKGVVEIERRQCLVAHTNYHGNPYTAIAESFGKRFTRVDDNEVDEFIEDYRRLKTMVTKIGGWFDLSRGFVDDSAFILQCLDDCRVYNGYTTMMYCWTKAILESALRVGHSRYQMPYQKSENKKFSSTGEIFTDAIQSVGSLPDFEIIDSHGNVVPQQKVERMLSAVTDHKGACLAAALLLDRMANTGDHRSAQLITLSSGEDVSFIANKSSGNPVFKTHSKDVQIDDTYFAGPLRHTSARDKIVDMCSEAPGLFSKPHYERVSANFVPMTWTSFFVHRQHTFMNLMLFMGLSVIFVVFGQAHKD